MSDTTLRTIQVIVIILTAIIVPGIVVLLKNVKKKAKEEADQSRVNLLILEHVTECNKLPKVILVQKLDNLSEKIETQHTNLVEKIETQHKDLEEFKQDFKAENGFQRQRYHDLNNAIQTIIIQGDTNGRQKRKQLRRANARENS